MLHNQDDAHIVHAMLDLGLTFGLKVIAEGIEDRGTLDRLATMGGEYGQGYYISRPMAFDELLEWIEHSGRAGSNVTGPDEYQKGRGA